MTDTLFPDCVLPGCRNPAVGQGTPCDPCRATWGPYLLAPGQKNPWLPDTEPACGHGFWWWSSRLGRCNHTSGCRNTEWRPITRKGN